VRQPIDPLAALPPRWRLAVRAVRGATTVAADEPALIRAATIELLDAVLLANHVPAARLISAIFTVTPDLCSEFPARAARDLGWHDVPLLCAQEIDVPGALPRCIRVLLHVACARPRSRIRHVYLRDAATLRPDLLRAGERVPREPRRRGTVRVARLVPPAARREVRR
jgi:chorismate mutase